MGNIYQKIKKASPLKDGHDWKPTDKNVTNSAGDKLMNAESRTIAGEKKTILYSDLPEAIQAEARKYNKDKYGTINPTAAGLTDNTTQGDDVVQYRGDEPDTLGTPAKPESSTYNAGFYEAFSARLAAKQENKMAKQKEKRDNKSIRKYEEGSRGFLGIGKDKGKGELNERVVSGYESRGKKNDNFNYDADGNITGEKGTLEGQVGKKGMGNEFSDQVVTKQMRDRANTLSMNKTGQALGSKRFYNDGKEKEEGTTGAQNVAGAVTTKNLINKNKSALKKVTGKSLIKQSMFGGAGNIAGNAMLYNQDQGDSPLSRLKNRKRGPGY